MRHAPESATTLASWALLALSVLLVMTLSPETLAFIGIPYDLPGGPMVAKLHPGTYALTAAFVLGLIGRGNGLAVLITLVRQRPLVAVYLGCMLFVGVWALWRHGTAGAAFIVDSLWMPGVALFTLALHPRYRQRQLLRLVMAVLAVNALMALMEYGMAQTFIPQNVGHEGRQADDYFRSSALLGHPLNNALIVASLLPLATLLPLRTTLKVMLVLLLALSMLAYGGRSSLAAVLLLYGGALLLGLARRAATGEFSYQQWLGGLLTVFLGLAALVGLVAATGLGERIFANLVWDNSANVRLVVWHALDHLDAVDWWLGVSPARLADIATRIGLDLRYEALENFWIALLMQVGIFGFVPFVFGLACGVAHVWRQAPWPVRLGIVLFFIVSSGANTLSSKTVSLLLLFIGAQCAAAFNPASLATGRRQGVHAHRPLPRGAAYPSPVNRYWQARELS
jgi:hypothetical protein